MRALISVLLAVTLTFAAVPGPQAAPAPAESDAGAIGRTPPRLSFTSGEVSFWRPGAQDWAPAQVNTPLAPGDELYTANEADLELQVGSRAFVRAWGDTQLGLTNQEPDFLQLKVTSGHVSLDLRTVEPGRTVEVDTPHGAFTIDHPGYYRLDVTQGSSSFITRRAGQAQMTPAGGQAVSIAPSEEVVLEGAPTPTVQSYVAPELDVWDKWNYDRSDHLLDAMSARYVPAGVYGADDLDHYGDWRVVPTYGAVWIPQSVPTGWVPYSTGRWIADPHYGWTWVDTAPWGWAPYHYGRWVFADGFWAWAPGPVVVRPVYAPALVAFFGPPSVRLAVGVAGVSWVALSWGEPLVPWWGRPAFVGRPTWLGWSGPRVVNNVVVNRTTVVNVTNINVYKNTSVHNAVVAVREDSFGRRSVQEGRIERVDVQHLQPARGALAVKPDAASYVAASGRSARPPDTIVSRTVVATRRPARTVVAPSNAAPPETRSAGGLETRSGGGPAPRNAAPPARIVARPNTAPNAPTPARPAFGQSPAERQRPTVPAHIETAPRPQAPAAQPRPEIAPRAQAPAAPRERGESAARPQRQLPGQPANRLSPGHAQARPGQGEAQHERRGER